MSSEIKYVIGADFNSSEIVRRWQEVKEAQRLAEDSLKSLERQAKKLAGAGKEVGESLISNVVAARNNYILLTSDAAKLKSHIEQIAVAEGKRQHFLAQTARHLSIITPEDAALDRRKQTELQFYDDLRKAEAAIAAQRAAADAKHREEQEFALGLLRSELKLRGANQFAGQFVGPLPQSVFDMDMGRKGPMQIEVEQKGLAGHFQRLGLSSGMANLAVTQLSFAVDDFFTMVQQRGNVLDGLRASANNLSFVLAAFNFSPWLTLVPTAVNMLFTMGDAFDILGTKAAKANKELRISNIEAAAALKNNVAAQVKRLRSDIEPGGELAELERADQEQRNAINRRMAELQKQRFEASQKMKPSAVRAAALVFARGLRAIPGGSAVGGEIEKRFAEDFKGAAATKDISEVDLREARRELDKLEAASADRRKRSAPIEAARQQVADAKLARDILENQAKAEGSPGKSRITRQERKAIEAADVNVAKLTVVLERLELALREQQKELAKNKNVNRKANN